MKTLAVVLMMTGAAWAQSDADERAQRRADSLKNRLELNDEQTGAAKKAYAKEEEGRKKLEDERAAAIKEALNEEQKGQYDELRNRTSGRSGRGGQPQAGRGGFRGFGGGGFGQMDPAAMVGRLKEQLELSDDQVAKITPIFEESGAKIRKRFEDMRANGFQGVDWRAIMGEVRADMEKASEQVKGHLNDEQKTKYDEVVGQGMRMLSRFGGGGEQRQRGTATEGSRRGRRPSVEDRVARALEALKIEKEDERAAIAELLKQVVEAMYALEDHQRETRQILTDAGRDTELSDDAVKDRVKDRRNGRKELEKKLKGLRSNLSEVVTYRQELALVIQGILD